jgi:hypothetical protein
MWALAAGAALFTAMPSAAQTTATRDAVIRAIWAQGMDSSRAPELAQALLDSIGPRLTGTPQQRAAIDWALARYREWGIPARAERYGSWQGWRRGTSHIDLIAPRVRSLEGMLLAWSPGTRGRPVEAPVAILPDVADSAAFAAWLPRARGKMVLISFAQPTCRPDADLRANARPETVERLTRERAAAREAWDARLRKTGLTTRELPKALERAGALGIVTSLWSGGWGVDRIFQGRTTGIPTVDISCEDYGLVFRLAERGQSPRLRITADAQFLGEVPVFNVIGELRGTERPDEYVVLSAHFDSWDGASGATDNGTGTVVMMEAMRILKTVYPSPKRTILVGHWSGEEQGLNGSRAFAADNPRVVEGLQALFNQDNGTGRIVDISMQGLAGAEPVVRRWLSSVPAELTREIRIEAPGSPGRGGSDYASFLCHGAPAFNLRSLDFEYRTYTWHTTRDTYDKIVFDDVRGNATLTAMLAYLAAEEPMRVPRDRADLTAARDSTRTSRAANGRGDGAWPTCSEPARRAEDSPRWR